MEVFMVVRRLSIPLGCMLLAIAVSSLFASDVPKPLKARFVTGDPVWKEIPIRDELRNQYEKCWQTAVATILENNFDIATMDKDSGYARTTWNEGVVTVGGNWSYRVQVSLKFVFLPSDPKSPTGAAPGIDKVRVQAAGELAESKRGKIKNFFRGYD
ncbi:MAG TPA: hypothetical protein VKM93_21170 [Terriglobia bacterium]|nr:hypothetical protein [Terriglobia bacterium]